ncbi:type II secretion system F family protein [Methanobrevibacter ruminantium]|nr:type II secretion system F family protein [Methanobrevibacter ruminantium]
MSFLIIINPFSILIAVFVSFELSIAFLMFFILFALFILYLPKIRHENDYSSISKELPYALRQLSTELRAGKSLFDALDSIVDSDYGVLSREFSRVLEEIKYGETSENAFLNLEKRVNSKALSRVIYEILASLRIGSNLSHSLNIIAEDVNFDMRMKLKEYSEKLNAFIMIYTFLAILAPVIILTMLLAASVVIGDIVPSSLLFILYGLFFPMIIVFLAFAIKKLEPKL